MYRVLSEKSHRRGHFALSDRLRRLGSVCLILVAALASIATSPESDSLSRREHGPRIALSEIQPEATVSIEISPNAEAATAPEKSVHVFTNPVWGPLPAGSDSSIERTAPETVLEVAALDTQGNVVATSVGQSLTCRHPCPDVAAVRFRLTDASQGSLAVNWELEPRFFFGEGEVPSGADFEMVIGPADTRAGEVAARGRGSTDASDRFGFSSVRVQIHAPSGVPTGSNINFEPLYAFGGSLVQGGVLHEVVEGQSISIEPPERCGLGADCDWSFLLVASTIEWQLVAPPELGLEIGIAETAIAELAAPVISGGPIGLVAGEEVTLTAFVEVPSSVFSGVDFEAVDPGITLEFTLTADDGSEAPFVFRDSGFSSRREDSTTTAKNRLELDCFGNLCRAEVVLVVYFDEADGTFTWHAQAFLPFPVTGTPPAGAEITLEVSG